MTTAKYHKIIGQTYMIMSTIVFTIIFVFAAFSPTHQVILDINYYGEAWIEIIVFTAMLPFAIIQIYHTMQEIIYK